MTKQVKCVSPHGGCHNGMRTDGSPVQPVPIFGEDAAGNKIVTDSYLPEIAPEQLRLPPNPGGYRDDSRIPGRYAAVGQVYDVPDDFIADGFHWEDVAAPQPVPPAPASSEGTP